ncbi:DNA fragmentation factor subunit alpha [Cyprinodon tularosa]|uniref:DNA fragmentation factor subunit alpha n=1 Tax=Cyprinodon tularosa TaxID=77115 RepID=UPI0018E27F7C|nr:DNA fragmentation factor subunit alpha [Cyprinodon tularosa]
MSDRRPCKVCDFTRKNSYGMVVATLEELKRKGCELLGVNPTEPVTVVLETDGTIVEDQAYFLCLPLNTKFMLLHDKETWAPARTIDGGTAWMARESLILEVDAVDSSAVTPPWWNLALQLKQDLTSIILMSEGELQSLVDAPCSELASALGFQEKKTIELQETLQRVLDRKEEERQSKQLLQLYLKAVEKEDRLEAVGDVDSPDGMEVDSASGFMSRTLMVLKGKTSPETRLSTEDLQVVVSRGLEAMQQVLGWDAERTSTLMQACQAELSKRLQQVQAMQSISSTQQDGSRQREGAGMATQGSS